MKTRKRVDFLRERGRQLKYQRKLPDPLFCCYEGGHLFIYTGGDKIYYHNAKRQKQKINNNCKNIFLVQINY